MSNTLLTISMITNETLIVLENNLRFAKHVTRKYDSKFGVEGAKIGQTLNLRLPVQYVYTSGQGLQLQDVTEQSVPISLTKQYQRSFTFSSADLALSVDDFSRRFVRPAVINMANEIDYDGLSQYVNVFNSVGTPGTVPNLLSTYLAAGVKLDNNACPMDDERTIVYNPAAQASIVDTLKGLFQSSTEIAKQYKSGTMGMGIGFGWNMDQNVRKHTSGTYGGTPEVNAGSQTGSSLITDGWTASTATIKKGDVFEIEGVEAVNPQNFQSTGQLAQFVATADNTASGGGAMTISISPAITTSGPYQTVTASPADNADLYLISNASTSSVQNLAFHPDAFAFACADLELPNGVDMRARKSDDQLGMSIRLVRAYDINTDRYPLRLDLLGGWATIRPVLACRIQG